MIRGYNDRFYYVEKDLADQNSKVFEIRFDLERGTNSYIKRQVFSVTAANIICLQLNSLNDNFDSVWTLEGKIIKRQVEQTQLYILDENLDLTKIRLQDDIDEEIVWMKDIAQSQEIKKLNLAQAQSFVISDRGITVRDQCYVFETSLSFNIIKTDDDERILDT